MSHAENIQKNHDILLRCININVQVVACLRAADVLDAAKESLLEAEKAPYDKLCHLINWIKNSTAEVYDSFVEVMEENEQQHVANLLKGNKEDEHVPLSSDRHARLLRIRPKLMYMIHNNVSLIAALKSFNAISQTDAEDLGADRGPNYRKNFHLINTILRRSDHSFKCLEHVLRETHHQDTAEYLTKGDVIAMHVNTTRPDSDSNLSEALNATTMNKSMDQTAGIRGPDDAGCLKANTDNYEQLMSEMMDKTIVNEMEMIQSMDETTVNEIEIPHMNGLRIVGATPGNSIVIFVYCKTIINMVTFTKLFNSGELQTKLEDFLNHLFARIEPRATEKLKARITLDDDEILEIEEITGIEDWMGTQCEGPTLPGCRRTLASCDPKTDAEEKRISEPSYQAGQIADLEKRRYQPTAFSSATSQITDDDSGVYARSKSTNLSSATSQITDDESGVHGWSQRQDHGSSEYIDKIKGRNLYHDQIVDYVNKHSLSLPRKACSVPETRYRPRHTSPKDYDVSELAPPLNKFDQKWKDLLERTQKESDKQVKHIEHKALTEERRPTHRKRRPAPIPVSMSKRLLELRQTPQSTPHSSLVQSPEQPSVNNSDDDEGNETTSGSPQHSTSRDDPYICDDASSVLHILTQEK